MTTLKFNELTTKRKIAIQLILQEYPEVADDGLLTFNQFMTWWNAYEQDPNRVIGYPRWIVGNPETASGTRGVFSIPVPSSDAECVDITPTAKKKKVKTLKELTATENVATITVGETKASISEDDFAAELAAAGITL